MSNFTNIPEVKIGVVAVSRNCFPMSLSVTRREKIAEECKKLGINAVMIDKVVETYEDVSVAKKELKEQGANALVVYLGNFGPEGPETMIAQQFDGPVMFVGAAEEDDSKLYDDRGDAYCGMLNASYSLGLRNLKVYIPEYPVGTPDKVAAMINDFVDIARVRIGMSKLKIFSFGPRPEDFLACNAPIKPLFDLGVEIQENSELDLLEAFQKHDGDPRIAEIEAEMKAEVGMKDNMVGIIPKLAQYEITLLDWIEDNKGDSEYFAFANKCWPAFQTQFCFVPCYVNSRLMSKGIPVACETDIYGALSEYMIVCASCRPGTLLDINNTVPREMFEANKKAVGDYDEKDLFMGFHCGNTPISCLNCGELSYQLIMKRNLEPDVPEPNITRGTLEGSIKAGEITLFRLQGTADAKLQSYVAEGEVLPIDPHSFGGIGVIAIKEMGRFYRHVLIADRYPHHAGVAFARVGKALYSTVKMLGIENVKFNQPKNMLYKDENPFA